MFSVAIRNGATMLAAALLVSTASTPAWAQAAGSITGQVRERDTQRPLVGAQVFLPATGIGALTNASGRFLLVNVPVGEHTVQVQLLGYALEDQTVTVAAGAASTLDFGLRTTAIALDEIVVTGVGQAAERRQIGNLIESIDAAEVENVPIRNTTELLQARTPGVVVQVQEGVAGAGSRIRIRGSASMTQENDPVVYLDGVRIESSQGGEGLSGARPSRLDDINPESIERIEILKGAAAATLYGTEASNGVIQIFTKRGQSGAPRWTLSMEGGLSRHPEIPDLAGFALAENPTPGRDQGTRALSEHWGRPIQPYEVFTFNLTDYVFETGRHTDNSLSVTGGTDVITYYVGGRYSLEDGIIGGKQYREPGESFYSDVHEVKQLSSSIHLLPTQNLRLEFTTRYTDRVQNPGAGSQGVAGVTPLSKIEQAHKFNYIGKTAFNTFRETLRQIDVEETKRYGGALTARYALTPNLDFDATTGIDVVSAVSTDYRPFGWNVDGYSNTQPQGGRNVTNRDHTEFTLDGKVNWRANLGGQFTSTVTVGTQTLIANTRLVRGSGENFPAPGLEVVGAGTIQRSFESILKTVNTGGYVQQQIGFRDGLFLTYGARIDRHSAFGQDAGAAIYPKVSFSWVASEMLGWSGTLLSTLRVRGALGQAGLQPGAFDKFTTFAPLASVEGGGVTPDNLGNPNLRPEVSTEWEGGFEAGLFENRIALEGTYWNRTVNDLLIARQFPSSGGFLQRQLDNVGQMKAWGLELSVSGRVYSSPRLSVDLYANGAFMREKITDMGGAPPIGGGTRSIHWIREGYAPGSLFGAKLVDAEYPFDTNQDRQPDSRAQILQYFSVPRTVEHVEARTMGVRDEFGGFDGHYKGKTTPDWTGSFGADISFGNFTVRNNFYYAIGNYKMQALHREFRLGHPNIGRNMVESATWDVQLMNPKSTPEERLEAALWFAHNTMSLGRLNGMHQAQIADYISWREVSVTYRLSAELLNRLGADGLSITAAGRNLVKFTKYPGMSQERTDSTTGFAEGNDGHLYAIPRRVSLALSVNF